MSKINIENPNSRDRGYSTSLVYQDLENDVRIGIGNDGRLSEFVVTIEDKFFSIAIFDLQAQEIADQYFRENFDKTSKEKRDRWAQTAISVMYRYVDKEYISCLFYEAYKQGFEEGDESRTRTIRKALQLL